jgi:hypothetical protein
MVSGAADAARSEALLVDLYPKTVTHVASVHARRCRRAYA